MLDFLKKLLGFDSTPAVDYREMLAAGAIIVDVRTPAEYKSGHIKGSLNLPLDSIGGHTDALLKKGVPVITCCRSGARSGMAVGILRKAGIEAVNGGAWDGLQAKI